MTATHAVQQVSQLYQIGEFAQRTGVTIRTLHHYDRIGLLKPSVVAESGYRLYTDRDIVRLQQIVTLKFIGLSLKQIREMFATEAYDLAAMLRLQCDILEEKRRGLDRAIQALRTAEHRAAIHGDADWESFQQIIEVLIMASNKDVFANYFTPEQLAEFERRSAADPDAVRQGENDWSELIREVEASVGEDPAGEHAQALAARWAELVNRFTLGDPDVEARLKQLHTDNALWQTMPKPYSDEALAFIVKAQSIRREQSPG
ncbi:MAG: MerR family transcriptional regulator [Bacteroidetes bacterium]|nr:MerR family transcriptional regulator [Bacteroidota bacterium]